VGRCSKYQQKLGYAGTPRDALALCQFFWLKQKSAPLYGLCQPYSNTVFSRKLNRAVYALCCVDMRIRAGVCWSMDAHSSGPSVLRRPTNGQSDITSHHNSPACYGSVRRRMYNSCDVLRRRLRSRYRVYLLPRIGKPNDAFVQ